MIFKIYTDTQFLTELEAEDGETALRNVQKMTSFQLLGVDLAAVPDGVMRFKEGDAVTSECGKAAKICKCYPESQNYAIQFGDTRCDSYNKVPAANVDKKFHLTRFTLQHRTESVWHDNTVLPKRITEAEADQILQNCRRMFINPSSYRLISK
jgi:hypothetical protein